MKNLRLALLPMVAAAGILALSGVAVAQVVIVASANCPQAQGYETENNRGPSAELGSTVCRQKPRRLTK